MSNEIKITVTLHDLRMSRIAAVNSGQHLIDLCRFNKCPEAHPAVPSGELMHDYLCENRTKKCRDSKARCRDSKSTKEIIPAGWAYL